MPLSDIMNLTSPAHNASNASCEGLGKHAVWEVVLIVMVTGPLSLVTIIGNLLVMVSFRVNSHLRTVNNYFLLSLACADLVLGAVSMNLYTTFIIMECWALGRLACDIWLALDYVASNASVMNLLIISFDRFFSVTRPLTYRAKRTPRRAAIMIGLAWTISFLLWAPAILFWEYVVGKRTVLDGDCAIQFLSQPIITFGTAIAAFYLPVTIMIILYWRVYRETENRTRELAGLLGSTAPEHGAPPPPHSCSTKSSSSSCETHGGADGSPGHGVRGCLSCRQVLPRSRTAAPRQAQAFLQPSSNGNWQLEEDGSSSSEEEPEPGPRGVGAKVVRAPWVRAAGGGSPGGSGVQAGARGSSQVGGLGLLAVNPSPSLPKAPKAKKRRNTSLIKEKKAAKTLSAILLAFIITWTPYNIMVLVSTFCTTCVPDKLWQLGYWLCYVNSTVNPMCYALCNKSFRITFKMLLRCRWDKRKWGKPHPSAPPSFRPCTSSSSSV
ncbi:muscarinic acetylcholine receptor M1 [Amia ocellicauda]|uniref:muscarinic acetylcholine receptor M1 n=1 Tax=Amia ocellicauda TaxID=2972642 RepID=UPI003463D591